VKLEALGHIVHVMNDFRPRDEPGGAILPCPAETALGAALRVMPVVVVTGARLGDLKEAHNLSMPQTGVPS
jgi:hypothetical protein